MTPINFTIALAVVVGLGVWAVTYIWHRHQVRDIRATACRKQYRLESRILHMDWVIDNHRRTTGMLKAKLDNLLHQQGKNS